jgi:hypothetical protein
VPLDIEHIEVFEATETAQVEKQTDRYNFTLRHDRRAFRGLTQNERAGSFIKIFTEFINKTENIANFIEVNHVEMYLNI